MNLSEAEDLARSLIFKHLSKRKITCGFSWMNRKRHLGLASYYNGIYKIHLSREFVKLNEKHIIEDVILHEIAHVIAGLNNGHNKVWKSACIKIGAKPNRLLKASNVNVPIHKYEVVCKNCKNIVAKYYRKPSAIKSKCCKACGPFKGKLTLNQRISS